jgi:hypothetical protein
VVAHVHVGESPPCKRVGCVWWRGLRGSSVLNGCAVFVPKHALAMAHAIEGGKCKVWEKWPSGQPQAGGSEYLELHGAFSIALRAPGAALLRRLGFLAGRGAREIAFAFALVGGALRGGWPPC